MKRPCECRLDSCPFCWRVANVTEYAALFGEPPPANPVPLRKSKPAPTPCRHRGDDLTHAERTARALDHRKAWATCERPGFARYGLPVCGCTGCGPKCPGYER